MLSVFDNIFFIPFIAIISVTLGFLIYLFAGNSKKAKNGSVGLILYQRLLGIFFFGFLNAILVVFLFNKQVSSFGFSVSQLPKTLLYTLILAGIIVPTNFFVSKKQFNQAMYPQIRVKIWNYNLILLSALSWITYLLAYEFMFRGFLLHAFLPLGIPLAVAINTSIYSLAHIHKGLVETIAAVPLGIVLCLITINTSNIMGAWFVHCLLALTNEWFCIYHNPTIRIVK